VEPLAHIGINAVFLRPQMGGIETYVRRLLPELAELAPRTRITVFVSREGAPVLAGEPWAGQVALETHPLLGIRYLRAASEMLLLGRLAAARRIDVLQSVALTGPLRRSRETAHVVTLGDLTWIHQPDSVDRLTGATWRTFVPRIAAAADRVLTYSEAGRRDVVDLIGVPEERVDAVPLGPGSGDAGEGTSSGALRRRLGLGAGPIVLAVAANRPNKNGPGLVRAMAEVVESVPEAVLALAGQPGISQGELDSEVARLGLGGSVRFVGHLEQVDLEGLYRAASCLALPSFYEGFGLPILEAMRRGLPVACSRASSLPEVAGEAAEYFDPHLPADIARAIVAVLTDRDLADRLTAAGRERQRRFSWRATAEGTLACLERARREHAL
jgi:glycosyltransferase involved in cell wall biosynthesis